MYKERNHPRYASVAQAELKNVIDGPVLLEDISITGCRVQSKQEITLIPATLCIIKIIPEQQSGLEPFDFPAETRWIRKTDDGWEAGFFIAASPQGDEFMRYVDYLAFRDKKN
jgi:hypothetical protein